MSSETSAHRILVLGASGFVGGTVLHFLLQSSNPHLSKAPITVLVRGEDRVQKLTEVYGNRIKALVFDGLDDTDRIASIASQHDIVINAAVGTHAGGPEAIIRGLEAGIASSSRKTTGSNSSSSKPWLIQVGGVTDFADHPLMGAPHPDHWHDDADALAIYEFQKAQDAIVPYFQRTAALGAIDAAEAAGVNALIISSPAIFGRGRGLFSTKAQIIPFGMNFVLEKGYAFQLNESAGWGVVHVDDLAKLFVLATEKILEDGGQTIPRGKKGTVFAQVGEVKVADVMRRCLATAFQHGALPKVDGPQQQELRTVDKDEIAAYFGGGDFGRLLATVVYECHIKTKSTMAYQLGWKPEHGMDAFNDQAQWDFELQAALEARK